MRLCVVFATLIVVSGPGAAWCGQYNVSDLGSFGGSNGDLGPNGAGPSPGLATGGLSSGVSCISANGEIVGWYTNLDSLTHAFSATVSDPSDVVDLGTLGGNYSVAQGVNSQGEIVGESTTAPGGSVLHAFLDDGSTMVDLNSSLVAGSGWELLDATSITDQGWIVGSGINPAGQTDGFLLTPRPVAEPSSLVLLGVGGVCLAALTRRWRKSQKAPCPVRVPTVRSK